jgi:anti-sigma regulatory factor (Ser/Thr protein kinase)
MAAKLTLSFKIDTALIRPIREALKGVAGAWGAGDVDILDTQFAVSAAIETIFLHVYGREGGPVSLTMTALDDPGRPGMNITVEAFGMPGNAPRFIPAIAPDWEGYALYAIGRLMDEAAIVAPAEGFQGWRIQMVKRFGAPGEVD